MINNKVLAIILGGGQGSRLHPLTEQRSKPAVPIAGKYRLVDIPISNCINSDIKRMFVLTFLVLLLLMCLLLNKPLTTKHGFKVLPMLLDKVCITF
jgi:ADP-glucose pyrophosphorylase